MSQTETIFILKNNAITTEIMGIECLQLRETLQNTGCIEKGNFNVLQHHKCSRL